MWKKVSFLLFLCVFCAAASAKDAEEIRLSDTESLAVAEMLSKKGDLDSARKIYAAMLESSDRDVRVESVFQLAGVAMAMGDFDTAISYYLAILNRDPGLTRVRLELARAYFMNRDFSEAEFHFLFARADLSLPPEVAEKIDVFLMLIRQQKNWTFDVGFSIVPDSNINLASGIAEECVATPLGYLCRPLEKQASGVGFRLITEGNYYARFTKRFGLHATAGLSMLDFPSGGFDDYELQFAMGPRYVFDKAEVSLRPNYSSRWYRGRHYNDSYGVGADTNWQAAARWLLNVGAFWRTNVYSDRRINEIAGNCDDLGVYSRPRYYLDSKSFLIAGLGYNKNDAKFDWYKSGSAMYSLGYFKEFGLGLTLFMRADIIDMRYKGANWFVMKDGGMEFLRRKDLIYQSYVRVSHRALQYWNMTPALSYTYVRRDGNAWQNDFDKHRVEIEIIRRF
ncbi:MAG: surface lipoprotein assembly modifier [Rickettsiales bacterium]|jgi:tetratricopeptide (TPR) repeat protein|nr:surface lipoprotein assembly modifier [Rickettsiales bacterium]